jgi:hypothetical protein
MQQEKLKAKYGDGSMEKKPKSKSLFNTYFLIDPDNSRPYFVWKIFFFLAGLLELVLTPYTICMGVNRMIFKDDLESREVNFYMELIIDIMWLINIFVTFCTAVKKDFGLEKEFSQIA